MQLTNLPSWMQRSLRHVLFAIVSIQLMQLVSYLASKYDYTAMERMSIGAAYTAIFFFAATFLVTPWYKLRGRSIPVSIYLRRDLGIWTALYALTHFYVGLNVYENYTIADYFFSSTGGIRLDSFGIANYLGLFVGLVLLVLICLSNNMSIRLVGVLKWKKVQQSAYVAFAMAGAHGILYQLYEQRERIFIVVLLCVFVAICLTQIWLRRRVV